MTRLPVSKPLNRAMLCIEPTGDEKYTNPTPFDTGGGQAQIHAGNGDWTLHLLGDTEHWRHLAAVIMSAAEHVENMAHADRYCSPLGDRRERSVPCSICRRPTFALDAMCDVCQDKAQGYADDARGGAA